MEKFQPRRLLDAASDHRDGHLINGLQIMGGSFLLSLLFAFFLSILRHREAVKHQSPGSRSAPREPDDKHPGTRNGFNKT